MTNYFLHVLQSNEGHKEVPYHGGAIFHLSSLHPFPFIEPLILRTQQVHTPKGTNKQTNQPAPCPEAANQAATYRFPSEQISPCTHKNFFFPVRTQNHHILRKVWCHMWRQCASNKQMVCIWLIQNCTCDGEMDHEPTLSFFLRKKNWTRDL